MTDAVQPIRNEAAALGVKHPQPMSESRCFVFGGNRFQATGLPWAMLKRPAPRPRCYE